MPDILLKDVDQQVYDELRSRAEAQGLEVSELLLRQSLNASKHENHFARSSSSPVINKAEVTEGPDEDYPSPPEDWIDPLEATFGTDPKMQWLLEFRRKHWDGLMTDEEADNFQRLIKDKPQRPPKAEKRPPPDDWVDPLASVDREDETFKWLLKFRREHWNGLRTPEEYEAFVEATKRTDVGGPGIYEAE